MIRSWYVEYFNTAVITLASCFFTAVVILGNDRRLSIENFITITGWLVAAVVTVVGWRVNVRAQQKLFRAQVKNGARGQIVAAVRSYQDALREWDMTVFSLMTSFESGETRTWTERNWQVWLNGFTAKRDAVNKLILTSVLEQYELLFPATKTGRRDLQVFSGRTYVKLSDLFVGLTTPAGRNDACAKAQEIKDRMTQELMLLEDLLVYVQNEALGDVVGRRVPFFRSQRFAATPRFELRDEGLVLTDGTGARLFSPASGVSTNAKT